ncbi:general stress protein [Nostoc sp.]|uniref:general stress protein n=1 Tax=Nostoc sp. TaxID=1180 RepID=UPI002FF5EAC4
MTYTHTVVAHFPSHAEAERVVLDLRKSGFDMQKLSIIGKDYQTTEHVRGFLTWKDAAIAGAAGGGYWGSFVGGLFGILAGAGVLFVPGIAPIIIAGPIAGVLAGWLEGTLVGAVGAAAVGGLAGALSGLGIPKHEVLKYETQIQAGEFIILVTGSNEDVSQAKQMLDRISHGISMSVAV